MAEEGRKNENEPSGRPNPEGEVSLPALLEASKSLETSLDSDSDAPKTGSSSSKKRQPFDSDSEAPKTETSKKRTWSLEEVTAVEKTLMAFINSGKVPGNYVCVTCIKASPEALQNRSWTAIKFYVKNRITAIQRESAKRIY